MQETFINGYRVWLKDKLWIKSTIAKNVGIDNEKILFTQHHISHAAVAYYTSPFKSAAILTCDGVGEWTTTSWGKGMRNKIILEKEISFHTLWVFYSTFTQFLGFLMRVSSK